MKYSLRTLSIIVALGLLVAVIGMGPAFFGASPVFAAAITVAEDEVEWAALDGNDISSVRPDVTADFLIRDDVLEKTNSGTAVFSGIPASSKFFDIGNAAAGTASPGTRSVTMTLTAAGYNTTTPSSTPLTGSPTVDVGGNNQLVTTFSITAGTVNIFTGVSATTTISFGFHQADTWDGQDDALRRAKVTSTSDPSGEWITIDEVASISTTSTSATSKLFRGRVELKSDAGAQGTNNDGVWVQDLDVLTVTYYDSDGLALDSDTVDVDGVDPTITNILPADGAITDIANPTVQFDVIDTGSGITAVNPANAISLEINGIAASNVSFQAIADGFRAIFAQGTSWLTLFNVGDSTKFTMKIVATDQAGNSTTVELEDAEVTIDLTSPTIDGAVTGSDNTELTITFSEDMNASSIDSDGGDFTVAGATVTAAAQPEDDDGDAIENKVELTVTALDPDDKPLVTVIGTIEDKAGNAVDVDTEADSEATALDGIAPTLSSRTW